MTQWIECRPANQRVAGLIPSQSTCLGCGPGPQLGVCERQPHIDVSLFLPPLPSLKSKIMFFKKYLIRDALIQPENQIIFWLGEGKWYL